MFVASDTTQDDIIFLSTLEGVNARDFDLLVQVFLQGAVVLHVVDDIRPLTFVRRNDTNLVRSHTRPEELGNHLFDVARLGAIEERGTAGRNLFVAEILVKKHRRLWHGPREIDVFADSLGSSDTILQSAFVEHVGGKLRQAWVHSVLDLQTNGSVTEDDEPFKQRLRKTSPRSFLVHDDGTELLMIADKDDLLAAHDERDHAF